MTAAIAHREADQVIIDLVRERRPPFSPTHVRLEFSAALKSYGIGSVQSDKYAGSWVVESFAAHGIRCEQSAKPKSDFFAVVEQQAHRVARPSAPCHPALRAGAQNGARPSGQHRPRARRARRPCQRRCGRRCARARSLQGVVVTSELLQRVAAMPATRKHSAWGFRGRAALANMVIARQQCYPRSALPASKFEQGGESR
jgi:hypothetical protein